MSLQTIRAHRNFTKIPRDFQHRSKLKPLPSVLLSVLERRAGDQADTKIFNSKLYKEFCYQSRNAGLRPPKERQMRYYLSQLEKKGFISRICERHYNEKRGRVATVRIFRIHTVMQATGGRICHGHASRFTGGDPRRLVGHRVEGIIHPYDFTPSRYEKVIKTLWQENYHRRELAGIITDTFLNNFQRDRRLIEVNTEWLGANRHVKASFLRTNGNRTRMAELNNHNNSGERKRIKNAVRRNKRMDEILKTKLVRLPIHDEAERKHAEKMREMGKLFEIQQQLREVNKQLGIKPKQPHLESPAYIQAEYWYNVLRNKDKYGPEQRRDIIIEMSEKIGLKTAKEFLK